MARRRSPLDDNSGDGAIAQRDDDARASRRSNDAIGNGVRQEIETRDGDCDGNQQN